MGHEWDENGSMNRIQVRLLNQGGNGIGAGAVSTMATGKWYIRQRFAYVMTHRLHHIISCGYMSSKNHLTMGYYFGNGRFVTNGILPLVAIELLIHPNSYSVSAAAQQPKLNTQHAIHKLFLLRRNISVSNNCHRQGKGGIVFLKLCVVATTRE